jgi:cytochrome b561
MKNSVDRYGAMTKTLHWAGFLLVLNQFLVAAVMLTIGEGETRDALYQWHKSVGLLVLALVIVRYTWRKITPLPDWAPNLSAGEKRAIHWAERILYACMFVMPISGYVFVAAGDYPLAFFGLANVPNIVGVNHPLSVAAQWTHALTAAVLGVAILAHWGVVFRHQMVHRDRYPHRMLPFTHQR